MEFKADEKFLDCPYNSFIQVSQYGSVRTKNKQILKQTFFKGYLTVEDPSNKRPYETVHRLVALTWRYNEYKQKNREKKAGEHLVVHHENGNGFINSANNLKWLGSEEHLVEHGWRLDERGTFIKGC